MRELLLRFVCVIALPVGVICACTRLNAAPQIVFSLPNGDTLVASDKQLRMEDPRPTLMAVSESGGHIVILIEYGSQGGWTLLHIGGGKRSLVAQHSTPLPDGSLASRVREVAINNKGKIACTFEQRDSNEVCLCSWEDGQLVDLLKGLEGHWEMPLSLHVRGLGQQNIYVMNDGRIVGLGEGCVGVFAPQSNDRHKLDWEEGGFTITKLLGRGTSAVVLSGIGAASLDVQADGSTALTPLPVVPGNALRADATEYEKLQHRAMTGPAGPSSFNSHRVFAWCIAGSNQLFRHDADSSTPTLVLKTGPNEHLRAAVTTILGVCVNDAGHVVTALEVDSSFVIAVWDKDGRLVSSSRPQPSEDTTGLPPAPIQFLERAPSQFQVTDIATLKNGDVYCCRLDSQGLFSTSNNVATPVLVNDMTIGRHKIWTALPREALLLFFPFVEVRVEDRGNDYWALVDLRKKPDPPNKRGNTKKAPSQRKQPTPKNKPTPD